MIDAPRHDLEAERAVLGAVLLEPECLDDVVAVVRAGAFYHPAHGLVFEAVVALAEARQPVDVVTLAERLRAGGRLTTIGGSQFLGELTDAVATTAHVVAHARIVAACAELRRLAEVGREITARAHDPAATPAAAIEFAQARVMDLDARPTGADAAALIDVLGETFEEIERIADGKQTPGVRTGFADLDRMLGGLRPGQVVIVGARPSQGKTSLALNLVANAARAGARCLFYSLEMKRIELGKRLLCMEGRVDANRLRNALLTGADVTAMGAAAQRLHALPLWINDLSELSPALLAAKSRRHKLRHGLDLIVIDYVGLMDANASNDSHEREVSEISRAIKKLAGTLDVPIVVLAQLNRKCEERADKRPQLADLRDSGSLEQDADAVLFVYRDEFYNKKTKDPGIAEVIVAKQRNGPTGVVRLKWLAELTKFENLMPDYAEGRAA